MAKRTCVINGCDSPHLSRGWCAKHYARWSRNGDPEKVERIRGDDKLRLWSQVDRRSPDECWPWTGRIDDKGRAAWQVGATKTARPYRMAYELEVGPIPDGMTLDHLCHTNDPSCYGDSSCPHRRCCNPAHLEPVTAEENSSRRKHRSDTCKRGHTFTPENTYINTKGHRVCRICKRSSQKLWKARQSS
jgi:hypothetical protein